MNVINIIENTIYFLALINPPSKILLLSTRYPAFKRSELFSISLRATLIALFILLSLTCIGRVLFVSVFHVEIYSLSVGGGVIIFLIGLKAVQEGSFFYETTNNSQSADISVVPLAAPLIAGPAVITAAISSASMYGIMPTLLWIVTALSINFVLMLVSLDIGRTMEKFNLTGPMVRIMGLIVIAVATQMIFSGCGTWLKSVLISSGHSAAW